MAEGSQSGGDCNSTYEAQYKLVVECFSKLCLRGPSDPRLENLKKFKPRPSDVFLLSPQKCGSTWTQQIIHGVRSRGNMEFTDCNSKFPLMEMAADDGHDIHVDQPYSPRCFKSHRAWEDRPKGHKYIIVVRDPKDVLVSMHEYRRGWLTPEDTPIDIFAKVFMLEHREHIYSTVHDSISCWWPCRKDPNTLWLHYEDLQQDLPSVVKLITSFMGFDAQDTELLEIVTKQASFEFMKAHEDKFRTENRGFKPGVDRGPSKVNKGTMGRKALLPEATRLGMDEDWKKVVQPVTGFPSFSEMRDHVNQELGRPWAAQN